MQPTRPLIFLDDPVIFRVVTGVLLYLAINRLIINSFEVQSTPMMIVAGCAVLFNILIGFILHGSGHVHSHGGSGGKRLPQKIHFKGLLWDFFNFQATIIVMVRRVVSNI
jgi:Co/Zn/Cd efflux system component